MGASGDNEGDRIETPSINDVLCGRGGSINSHKGNEQFRELVEKRKRVYLTARFKREKRLIASGIVSEIRAMNPSGRFLSRKGNKDSGHWYDIGDEKARDKTSQALRENAPNIRAEIETEINEQRAEMQRQETNDPIAGFPAYAAAPQGHPYYQQAAPPPHHPSHQAYWDWYHHYYGYPQGAQQQIGHFPPPPPSSMPAPAHAHAPRPDYWGQSVVPSIPPPQNTAMTSQEEEDRRLALELQQEEKAALLEDRKKRYKHSLSRRSNAHLGSQPRSSVVKSPQTSHVRRQPPGQYDLLSSTEKSQETTDHRIAAALQEEEDIIVLDPIQSSGERANKTSRSNVFSQARRTNTMSNDHSLSDSILSWFSNTIDSKPRATGSRRSVQFKGDEMNDSHFSHGAGTLQCQSSMASIDRPLPPHTEKNSFLVQAASHIIGWGASANEAQQPLEAKSSQPYLVQEEMETEGLEVQLRDPNNETTMPPPDPRVQTEWSSRSINSWTMESMNTGWNPGQKDYSLSGHMGIGPSYSIEMDTSANNASIGGESLCDLFNQDESLQRELLKMPSWERSMRSKSPLSLHEEPDASLIRVREMKLFRAAAPQKNVAAADITDMDWEEE